MEYLIWCDESDSRGKLYSNFYGGALVKSKDFNYVRSKLSVTKTENNFHGEIKWQKVSANYFERYIKAVDVFFDLIEKGFVKFRIMFTNNNALPKRTSTFFQKNEFFLLYYQFIKNAFGLINSNEGRHNINIRVYFDRLPNSKEKGKPFKNYVRGLNKNKEFINAGIKIRKEDVVDVISHQHDMIQFLDIILGAMSFYLNEKHKEFSPNTNILGKKTIIKEKLCNHIIKRIRKIYPKFNINETTNIEQENDLWNDKYRHWCFEFGNNEPKFD